MISYFVRYHGKAADPIAFARYYETAHAPILQRFPGIHSLILHQPVTWRDPFPVRDDGTSLLAHSGVLHTFPDSEDINFRGGRTMFILSLATSWRNVKS